MDNITLVVPWPEPSLMSYLEQKFPNWHFIEAKTSYSEAIGRVHNKKCELALIRDSALEIARPLSLYPNLNIIPDASINVPTSLVISPAQPRILQGILNKAITQINPENASISCKSTLSTASRNFPCSISYPSLLSIRGLRKVSFSF
jgi:hypothetical protein